MKIRQIRHLQSFNLNKKAQQFILLAAASSLMAFSACSEQKMPDLRNAPMGQPKLDTGQANRPEIISENNSVGSAIPLELRGIAASDLKECLPRIFNGAHMLAPSSGRSIKDGAIITRASSEYVYKEGTIGLTITDYAGAISTVMNRYTMPAAAETGIELRKINLPEGQGYQRLSPEEQTIEIFVVLGGRIAVDIKSRGEAKWLMDESKILKLIPAECLMQKLHKGSDSKSK
jgi:hypothetical protein